MDYKETLIALIVSLPNKDCIDIYNFIADKEYKCEYVTFDKVKITEQQYNKLLYMWGKDKTTICIDILNDWLTKKNITKKFSHYRNIIGWVERKYYQLYPTTDKSLQNFSTINTKWKAVKYIKQLPKELIHVDSEAILLVNKYGVDILNEI